MVSAARAAKLLGLGAVLVSATLWTGAAKAGVITDDFNFTLSGTSVANGSFSYDSSLSGTSLGFGNLDSFNISIPGAGPAGNYDLSFGSVATQYIWFDFNTATNQFVSGTGTNSSGQQPLTEVMGAIDPTFSSGFFITPAPNPLVVNFPFLAVGYDTVTVTSAVPEPSTLALLGAAVLAFGFLLRRKHAAPEALLAVEPEPSTRAFLGAAIAAFGFLLHRKRVAEASYAGELEAL